MQALRILVVVMGVMIVVGVAVVAVTIAKRAGIGTADRARPDAPAAADFGSLSVPLPPGATLAGEILHDNHLVLKTRFESGETGYVVVDLLTGRVRGTIRAVEMP